MWLHIVSFLLVLIALSIIGWGAYQDCKIRNRQKENLKQFEKILEGCSEKLETLEVLGELSQRYAEAYKQVLQFNELLKIEQDRQRKGTILQ
ncbi:hypothetical protein G3M81_12440 [Bacillus paralicheniformis]|uniref:hypothetical protein n=1 Tax=Bacillus TaxID=1386 RepID=UPI0013EF2437|nr:MULTISPECIES: hypothetical protein [Bacillus]MCY8609911.1 hypothetical protein [Bacillus haynesii]MEC0752146.1 hypothetical protein [Bacillus haynesii]QII49498.1 hypothetical protein G3M81_12440 [Bacillus paralicheniformis]